MATMKEAAVMEGMTVAAAMVAMIEAVEVLTMAATGVAVAAILEEVIDPATIEMGGIEMEDMGKHHHFNNY